MNELEGIPCNIVCSIGLLDVIATVIAWPYIFHITKFVLMTLLFPFTRRCLYKVLVEARKLYCCVLPSLWFDITEASP